VRGYTASQVVSMSIPQLGDVEVRPQTRRHFDAGTEVATLGRTYHKGINPILAIKRKRPLLKVIPVEDKPILPNRGLK
jgi:hypothetical protein